MAGADPIKLTLALNDVKNAEASKRLTPAFDDQEEDAPAANKKPKPKTKAASLFFHKKLDNRMQYLSSLLIEKNKALVRAFEALEVPRLDQVSLLELWWSTCEDRPRMQFHQKLCELDFFGRVQRRE